MPAGPLPPASPWPVEFALYVDLLREARRADAARPDDAAHTDALRVAGAVERVLLGRRSPTGGGAPPEDPAALLAAAARARGLPRPPDLRQGRGPAAALRKELFAASKPREASRIASSRSLPPSAARDEEKVLKEVRRRAVFHRRVRRRSWLAGGEPRSSPGCRSFVAGPARPGRAREKSTVVAGRPWAQELLEICKPYKLAETFVGANALLLSASPPTSGLDVEQDKGGYSYRLSAAGAAHGAAARMLKEVAADRFLAFGGTGPGAPHGWAEQLVDEIRFVRAQQEKITHGPDRPQVVSHRSSGRHGEGIPLLLQVRGFPLEARLHLEWALIKRAGHPCDENKESIVCLLNDLAKPASTGASRPEVELSRALRPRLLALVLSCAKPDAGGAGASGAAEEAFWSAHPWPLARLCCQDRTLLDAYLARLENATR
ncbi:MAG: hypothetical protein BJ554DRAFT_3155, partial [Olpidium bornovanus]